MAEHGHFYIEELAVCPFNPSHSIIRSRMQNHLVKCKKSHPTAEKATCPFNATHHIDHPELSYHLTVCEDRKVLDNFKYAVGVSSLPENVLPVENRDIPCEENWDDVDVPTYDPAHRLQDGSLLVQVKGATPSQREKFRQERRLMFQTQGGFYDASSFDGRGPKTRMTEECGAEPFLRPDDAAASTSSSGGSARDFLPAPHNGVAKGSHRDDQHNCSASSSSNGGTARNFLLPTPRDGVAKGSHRDNRSASSSSFRNGKAAHGGYYEEQTSDRNGQHSHEGAALASSDIYGERESYRAEGPQSHRDDPLPSTSGLGGGPSKNRMAANFNILPGPSSSADDESTGGSADERTWPALGAKARSNFEKVESPSWAGVTKGKTGAIPKRSGFDPGCSYDSGVSGSPYVSNNFRSDQRNAGHYDYQDYKSSESRGHSRHGYQEKYESLGKRSSSLRFDYNKRDLECSEEEGLCYDYPEKNYNYQDNQRYDYKKGSERSNERDHGHNIKENRGLKHYVGGQYDQDYDFSARKSDGERDPDVRDYGRPAENRHDNHFKNYPEMKTPKNCYDYSFKPSVHYDGEMCNFSFGGGSSDHSLGGLEAGKPGPSSYNERPTVSVVGWPALDEGRPASKQGWEAFDFNMTGIGRGSRRRDAH